MEKEKITIEQGVVGMNEQIEFEYYYGEEAEQFNFLMLPKFLLKEPRFAQLSDTSKILYSMMLERMGMSRKNGWFDDEGRPFIYYSIDCASKCAIATNNNRARVFVFCKFCRKILFNKLWRIAVNKFNIAV